MKKTITLGITGGIAAYKIVSLAKNLLKNGYVVKVIMTKNSAQFVDPAEFNKLSIPSYLDLFRNDFNYKKILLKKTVQHIDIADSTDLFVVAPASANVIAKLVYGIADDLLTTTVLAATSPILICPSMNSNMWANSSVQENIIKLKKRGFIILKPDRGDLACGYTGIGRLTDISKIEEKIAQIIHRSHLLKGRKIIITAGPTHEYIDSIRYITNKSSGRMGVALAEQAYLHGAEVLLLRSISSVKPLYPIKEIVFDTNESLWKSLQTNLPKYNAIFHTAAISDFKIINKNNGKLDSSIDCHISLKPRNKIIYEIKKLNSKIKLIGFKAVYKVSEKRMINEGNMLYSKTKADAIVVNDVGKKDRGFIVGTNEVFLIKNNEVIKIPLNTKQQIASKIIDNLIDILI